jgi:hypothetical protein
MCGAMEHPDGLANRQRFVAWFDIHVAPKYGGFMSGEDCYGLRCGLLHQGRLEPHRGWYSRVIFVEPGAISGTLHNNILGDALNIDPTIFVSDVVESALLWLETAEQTPEYAANYERSMQRYPTGLAPYISGVPVIA